jgi:hypothetical protein
MNTSQEEVSLMLPGPDDDTAAPDEDTAALETLAAELAGLSYQARLGGPAAGMSWLEVSNPRAPVLSERILVQSGWFWWPWAERLAPCGEAATAAAVVARVLRTIADGQP